KGEGEEEDARVGKRKLREKLSFFGEDSSAISEFPGWLRLLAVRSRTMETLCIMRTRDCLSIAAGADASSADRFDLFRSQIGDDWTFVARCSADGGRLLAKGAMDAGDHDAMPPESRRDGCPLIGDLLEAWTVVALVGFTEINMNLDLGRWLGAVVTDAVVRDRWAAADLKMLLHLVVGGAPGRWVVAGLAWLAAVGNMEDDAAARRRRSSRTAARLLRSSLRSRFYGRLRSVDRSLTESGSDGGPLGKMEHRISRPAAGTAAGGATMEGRRASGQHPPRHGPHNPQATIHATQNPTEV
ncbi:hypothetical protein ACLOJK_029282, partial [Asimina triloba]